MNAKVIVVSWVSLTGCSVPGTISGRNTSPMLVSSPGLATHFFPTTG